MTQRLIGRWYASSNGRSVSYQLSSSQQCGSSLRKINKHVEFPLLLDLAPFCSSSCQTIQPGQDKVLYSLYGVVEHSGRMSGGHYVAFVKVSCV